MEGDTGDQDVMKSCLECLAQLHGTGLAFGTRNLMARFPDMEEQATVKVTSWLQYCPVPSQTQSLQ